ncbi:MAG: tetratricopeptide repeat protein, partial [Bacteroidota bacterium]
MKKTVTALLLALSSVTYSQRNSIDSLVYLANDTTKVGQVPVYIHLSRIYYRISKDSCRLYAEKAVEAGMEAKDNKQIALALTHLAYFNEKIKNYEYSVEKIEEASNYAHLANDSNTIAWVHDRWGHICYQQDQLAATLEHYKKAINYAKGNYTNDGYARLIVNTATLIDDVEDYDLAIQYYSIVLDMINAGDSLSSGVVGQLYNSLGDYYSHLKQYGKAEKYMLQAYDIKIQTKQIRGQIVALGNLSNVYKHTSRYDEAEKVILKAYHLSDSIQNERYSITLASMLGSLYFDMKNYEEAEKYFKKGAELAKKNGYAVVLSTSYLDLCRLYILRNKLNDADAHLAKSLEIGHTTPNKELLMAIYRVDIDQGSWLIVRR